MLTSEPLAKLTITDDWAETTKSTVLEEPLLKENAHRFVLFPIQYNDFWGAYKNAEGRFWSAEEIELSDDVEGWEKMSGKERSFMFQVVALLAASDAIVPQSILQRFSDELQSPEARCFLGFMMMQRNIHTELCTVILDLFASSESARDDMLESVLALPSSSRRQAWVQRFLTDSDHPMSHRILALAVYVTVFQSSAFLSVLLLTSPTYVYGRRNRDVLLPGLVEGGLKLLGDHAKFTEFCSTVRGRLVNTIPDSFVMDMVHEAIKAEQSVMSDLFEVMSGTVSINGKMIALPWAHQFITYRAMECLKVMGVPNSIKAENPYPWLSTLLQKMDSNQEDVVVVAKQTPKKAAPVAFNLDEDF